MGKRGHTHIEADGILIDKDEGDSTPAQHVTLGTIDREFSKRCENDPRCWGCVVGFEKPDREGLMHKLWTVFENNKGKLHDLELCELIAELHKTTIADPLRDEGESNVLDWPADMVYRHIHYHMIIPRYEILDKIKKIKTIMTQLEDVLFEEDGASGQRQPNHMNLKAYATMATLHHKYLSIRLGE